MLYQSSFFKNVRNLAKYLIACANGLQYTQAYVIQLCDNICIDNEVPHIENINTIQ